MKRPVDVTEASCDFCGYIALVITVGETQIGYIPEDSSWAPLQEKWDQVTYYDSEWGLDKRGRHIYRDRCGQCAKQAVGETDGWKPAK